MRIPSGYTQNALPSIVEKMLLARHKKRTLWSNID